MKFIRQIIIFSLSVIFNSCYIIPSNADEDILRGEWTEQSSTGSKVVTKNLTFATDNKYSYSYTSASGGNIQEGDRKGESGEYSKSIKAITFHSKDGNHTRTYYYELGYNLNKLSLRILGEGPLSGFYFK